MRRWGWVVALTLALAAVLVGTRGRRPPPPAIADASAALPTDAAPPAVAEARDAGAGDAAVVPPSPFTAATRYADELRKCYSAKPPAEAFREGPWKLFGHPTSTAGVDLALTARGELTGATLWGGLGNARACLATAVAALPRASAIGQKTRTVRVPLRRLTQERFPTGDVRLFMTGGYYREEFPSWDLAGGWTAICPRNGGSALVHVVVTVNEAVDEEGDAWRVEARACPGDGVLLLKGPAVTGWLESRARDAGADDGGTDDGGARPETPEAEGVPLRTIRVADRELGERGITLALGTRKARLWAYGAADQPQMLILESTSELDLPRRESGSTAELLIEDGEGYRLLWAGDLDGDGRDDFVVEYTGPDDAPMIDLFLSSKAGGRLVRRAAGIARMAD
jgi:hypothetical protein